MVIKIRGGIVVKKLDTPNPVVVVKYSQTVTSIEVTQSWRRRVIFVHGVPELILPYQEGRLRVIKHPQATASFFGESLPSDFANRAELATSHGTLVLGITETDEGVGIELVQDPLVACFLGKMGLTHNQLENSNHPRVLEAFSVWRGNRQPTGLSLVARAIYNKFMPKIQGVTLVI